MKQLQSCIDIQCSNGNWNYDPYMHGMANGLILAMATLKGEEATFLSAPKEWLCDKKSDSPPTIVQADLQSHTTNGGE